MRQLLAFTQTQCRTGWVYSEGTELEPIGDIAITEVSDFTEAFIGKGKRKGYNISLEHRKLMPNGWKVEYVHDWTWTLIEAKIKATKMWRERVCGYSYSALPKERTYRYQHPTASTRNYAVIEEIEAEPAPEGPQLEFDIYPVVEATPLTALLPKTTYFNYNWAGKRIKDGMMSDDGTGSLDTGFFYIDYHNDLCFHKAIPACDSSDSKRRHWIAADMPDNLTQWDDGLYCIDDTEWIVPAPERIPPTIMK